MKLFAVILSILCVFISVTAVFAENIPLYTLNVSIDIEESLVRGTSTILLQDESEKAIYVNALKIISVKLNDKPFNPEINEGAFIVKGKGTLEISYEAIFKKKEITQTARQAGIVNENIISDDGVYLIGGWYPSIEGMALFSLTAIIPEGFRAVSEADEIISSKTTEGIEFAFHFPYPVREIHLVAAKYREQKVTFDGTDIYAYFFPEDINLARDYIEKTKKYLMLYREMIGRYPYKRFSIVENFLPTGYSMPTFTLLGQDVVRLPFIVDTSLGHEILHQWFGNYVYVDYETGNWSEGLTTYLSDHLYKEKEGEGWEYRKAILREYESYVNSKNQFSLEDFKSRVDFASKAIGYGKGAMVFHMLKNLIGEEAFYCGLREMIKGKKFEEASWNDLRRSFETCSGEALKWFFDQWVSRKGIPVIEIRDPRVVVSEGIRSVLFDLIQPEEEYKFNLNVKIQTDWGELVQKLRIERARESFEIPVYGKPLSMVVDPDYDIMRKLAEEESPPVLSVLLGDESALLVMPGDGREKYQSLMDIFQAEGFCVKDIAEIRDEDIRKKSLLIFGFDNPLLKRLYGNLQKRGSGFFMDIRKNPFDTSKVIGVVHADSKEQVDLIVRRLLHYGKYSFIRFQDGKNIEKSVKEAERGINMELFDPVVTVQPKKELHLEKIINSVSGKPVIYVGERHTNYEDHKVQLEVIMGLYERGRKFAIGMEMFQKPFQNALDDYISGAIGEKEFLKATEYFKRWNFDYSHYREIIQFAKTKHIPLVALNQRTEIIRKVASEGIDSLTEQEMEEIPAEMDMSDKDYKNRLREVFKRHKDKSVENFDYFYQSQILWDETMACSLDEFLKEKPDYQMVVLAGVGHVMYDSGIPQRAYRRNGKEYVTLIPDVGSLDEDIGDFVFFSEQISPPVSYKLGVLIKQTDKGTTIEKVIPGSIAKNAGLEKGDIIVSLNDWEVEDVDDVKIFMVGKKRGDALKIRILRKKFLSGYKPLELFTAI